MNLKQYITTCGEELLYAGSPDISLLDTLVKGPGDLWHSSLDQGFKNTFPELVYQTAVFWWFLNDFDDLDQSINWRINPDMFVVRKKVWELFNGLPSDYESEKMAAFDFGFRLLRYGGGVPMYAKGLYPAHHNEVKIPIEDSYIFYRKNFKLQHSYYMLARKGIQNPFKEWRAFRRAKAKMPEKNIFPVVTPRKLKMINTNSSVSVIIPTMSRQDFTLQLLEDYERQNFPVKEVIVVDATPENQRKIGIYNKEWSFKLIVKWQKSKGSCRARNEAILLCTGEYLIFGDDDTRIPPDFVENHLSFLHTFRAEACNGLDIPAKDYRHGLEELRNSLNKLGNKRYKAGAAQNFSNANSCVRKEWVERVIGNDINFDGGYGEDSDFGYRILKSGGIVLSNPYSVNLHLKPTVGGYRHWNLQANVLGRDRKKQAWEQGQPVKFIKPTPSPTVLYGIIKHFSSKQVKEYRLKYFYLYLFKKPKNRLLFRLLRMPLKYLQFNRSLYYAKNLLNKGEHF